MGMRIVLLIGLAACAGARKRIDMPEQLRGTGSFKQPPYSVKLTDNERTWQVWLPPVTGGYEVRIPIGKGEPIAGADGATRAKILSQDSAEFRAALARVEGLYRQKSYDLALLELMKLRQDFPDDVKLLTMQGTLHWKLGEKEKAQKAWQRVLELEPSNFSVLELLEKMETK